MNAVLAFGGIAVLLAGAALVDWVARRRSLFHDVTNQRLANQQGDLLRIEAKLDDIDFRLHRALGEHEQRLDNQAITQGSMLYHQERERKHVDGVVLAGDLTVKALKQLKTRIEKLESTEFQALSSKQISITEIPMTETPFGA